MSVSIEEFMKRLEAISEYEGTAYGRAHLIFESEDKYAAEILKYQGYLALSDAFKCFFLETIELINTECRPKIKQPLSEHYASFVPRMSQSFRSICGTERLATHGYPLQAYTLLRNIFDNVVLTSAALQKFTDFYSIEGLIPNQNFDPVEVKKLRKKTEFSIRKVMTGNQSGLTAETITELERWDALFDLETHGARLSATGAMDWLKGQGGLPVLPKFDESTFAMFMNRYTEIGWMLHRLIPLLQPSDAPLSDAWTKKWQILDESFEQAVHSLTTQLGKPIGAAVVEFVRAKYPFSAQSVFPL